MCCIGGSIDSVHSLSNPLSSKEHASVIVFVLFMVMQFTEHICLK